MSHSRAERRRSTRGGNAPPPKRDPMVPIYIGLAAVVVLVFIIFGITNYVQNKARADAFAFAVSTPSPGPSPTSKPVQLANLQAVGKAIGFPKSDLAHGNPEDTAQGGRGQDVDGIPCQTSEGVVLHIHSHLAIFDHGTQVQVPAFIGMSPNAQGGCLYWIHTHDPSGVIHVESGSVTAPQGGPFTLGMFFDIWGEQLSRDRVGAVRRHRHGVRQRAPVRRRFARDSAALASNHHARSRTTGRSTAELRAARRRLTPNVVRTIETARLRLRQWLPSDVEAWADMNEDPRVMEFFPAPARREHSREAAARMREDLERNGYGWFVMERKDAPGFAGVLALDDIRYDLPFRPLREIGWRLPVAAWHRGYATEGAGALLRYAFDELRWPEVVAMTAAINVRSRRVMERLGMQRDSAADFAHPRVPDDSPIKPHVLYRKRADWESS